MRILVLGHLSFDVFHAADGTETELYGGLFRTIAVLSAACAKGDRVVPVCGVGEPEHKEIIARLGELPGVDTTGIYAQPVPVHRVHYYFRDSRDYVECTRQLAPPIPFQRIKPYLGADGVLMNMVSGVDFTLETLDEIRMAVRGRDVPLHMDFHSLTTVVNERFERIRRPVEVWRRWAFMVDTLQFNEDEITGLAREPMSEEQTVGHLLTLGVHGVVVTRGAKGATAYKSEHKKVIRTEIPGSGTEEPLLAVGRGDVFGAAFHLHYLQHRDLIAAATHAHQIAATSDHSWSVPRIPPRNTGGQPA
jgi:hypothetical protein